MQLIAAVYHIKYFTCTHTSKNWSN